MYIIKHFKHLPFSKWGRCFTKRNYIGVSLTYLLIQKLLATYTYKKQISLYGDNCSFESIAVHNGLKGLNLSNSISILLLKFCFYLLLGIGTSSLSPVVEALSFSFGSICRHHYCYIKSTTYTYFLRRYDSLFSDLKYCFHPI